jgi:hypothetical protein
LNLTQDQVSAVTPIIQKYAGKRQELKEGMQEGAPVSDSMRAQMKQLKENESQELSQVLSADQMGQWQQMMHQGKHKHNSDENGEGNNGTSSE